MCSFTFYELDEDRKNTYFSTITGAFIVNFPAAILYSLHAIHREKLPYFRVTGIKISLHQKQDRKIFSKGLTKTAKISVQAFRNVITGNCFNLNYSTDLRLKFLMP